MISPTLTDGDGAAARDVQPREYAELITDLSLLERADRLIRRRAEVLQRAGDAEVILRLQLAGFDPDTPEWKELQNALIEYGYSVFVAWGRSGVLRTKAATHARGRGVIGQSRIPEGLHLTPDEAAELAAELMMTAVDKFRSRTLANPDPAKRWRPTGGASLKTYFIGRALMELPDVYQRLRKDSGRDSHEETTGELPDPRSHLGGIDQVADRDLIDRTLNTTSQRDRVILELVAEGFTVPEIAEAISAAGHRIAAGSVYSVISRFRNRPKEIS